MKLPHEPEIRAILKLHTFHILGIIAIGYASFQMDGSLALHLLCAALCLMLILEEVLVASHEIKDFYETKLREFDADEAEADRPFAQ